MSSEYDHVAVVYEFAKAHGYKVQHFNTQDRTNPRGRYYYVTVAFVVPAPEEERKGLADHIAELEATLNQGDEAQKD